MESKRGESKYTSDSEDETANNNNLNHSDSKSSSHDSDSDASVEREFKALLCTSQSGTISITADPVGKKIAEGFKINFMNMRDAASGEVMWESGEWGANMWKNEMKANISADVLDCSAVSREINFSSKEKMEGFKLEQRIYYQGMCIEEWFFSFGFVIPGSTNSWQQIIEAAQKDQMMTKEQLNGNVTIETSFYDGELFLAKCLVRVYYV